MYTLYTFSQTEHTSVTTPQSKTLIKIQKPCTMLPNVHQLTQR